MQFGTPKVPNGTPYAPHGTQSLNPTLMQFHASLRSCVIFYFFFKSFDTQNIFLIKLGHFDVFNSLVFKNHPVHHYFQKWIKSSFFKIHGFMLQTRGILPCLIHFQRKEIIIIYFLVFVKKKKIILTKISKKHAFIAN